MVDTLFLSKKAVVEEEAQLKNIFGQKNVTDMVTKAEVAVEKAKAKARAKVAVGQAAKEVKEKEKALTGAKKALDMASNGTAVQSSTNQTAGKGFDASVKVAEASVATAKAELRAAKKELTVKWVTAKMAVNASNAASKEVQKIMGKAVAMRIGTSAEKSGVVVQKLKEAKREVA